MQNDWPIGRYITALDNGLAIVRARSSNHLPAYAVHLTRGATIKVVAQDITDRGRAMDTFRKASLLVEAGRL